MQKAIWKRMLCLCMVATVLTVILAGCQKDALPAPTQPAPITQGSTESTEPTIPEATEPTLPQVTAPEDEAYVEPETQPPVQVEMPAYSLSYSGQMSELITYEELTEQSGLRFYIQISTGKVPLFTLLIGSDEGDFVQMKANQAGEQIPVSFLMDSPPEGISQEDTQTFLTAQELANEIVASLILK